MGAVEWNTHPMFFNDDVLRVRTGPVRRHHAPHAHSSTETGSRSRGDHFSRKVATDYQGELYARTAGAAAAAGALQRA